MVLLLIPSSLITPNFLCKYTTTAVQSISPCATVTAGWNALLSEFGPGEVIRILLSGWVIIPWLAAGSETHTASPHPSAACSQRCQAVTFPVNAEAHRYVLDSREQCVLQLYPCQEIRQSIYQQTCINHLPCSRHHDGYFGECQEIYDVVSNL